MGGVSLYACLLAKPCSRFSAERTSRILSHTFYPVVKFDSLVLVEPMLVTARHFKGTGRKSGLDDGALARRDFWESREEAWTSFSTKGMKGWDKRVVKLFVVSWTKTDLYTRSPHANVFAGVWSSRDGQ